jgi:hypothetical protein
MRTHGGRGRTDKQSDGVGPGTCFGAALDPPVLLAGSAGGGEQRLRGCASAARSRNDKHKHPYKSASLRAGTVWFLEKDWECGRLSMRAAQFPFLEAARAASKLSTAGRPLSGLSLLLTSVRLSDNPKPRLALGELPSWGRVPFPLPYQAYLRRMIIIWGLRTRRRRLLARAGEAHACSSLLFL